MSAQRKDGISVIAPFLNEEAGIFRFCKTVDEYIETLEFPVEIVFVNDGSTDGTMDLLRKYRFHYADKVRIVDLSKNYGFHAAARAGITKAYFDICTWISIDLQEPLDILPIAFKKIHDEKNEAVYFEKRTVKVSVINRMCSKIYSYLMQKYAVKEYSSDGTATIAFGKKIKDVLNHNIESNSLLTLQIMNSGFKHVCIPLDYYGRMEGESKWTLSKKLKLFIDSFVSFSFMPIRMVSIAGVVIFFAGLIIGILTIVNKIHNPDSPLGYATIVSVLALGFGLTNISLGIVAEYLWRTYDVARRRPVFIISDEIEQK